MSPEASSKPMDQPQQKTVGRTFWAGRAVRREDDGNVERGRCHDAIW